LLTPAALYKMKHAEYGTLEPVEVPQKISRSKTLMTATVSLLIVSAVVALSFGSGLIKANKSVDTNRNRSEITSLHADVESMFSATCKDMNTRYVIAQFNDKRDQLVPTVLAAADPFNWNNDFAKFKNMEPSYRAATEVSEGQPGVSFAVFNLPVFTDAMKQTYEVIPTFVAYIDGEADTSSRYLGGTFLGAAALAASCTATTVSVSQSDLKDYTSFCEKVVNQLLEDEAVLHEDPKAQKFHKLFEITGDEAADKSIVNARCTAGANTNDCPFSDSTVCNTCEGVANWGASAYHKVEGCCEGITDLCANEKKRGCSKFQRAIYSRNCNKRFDSPEDRSPKVVLLGGVAGDAMKCEAVCKKRCYDVAEKMGGLKKATYEMCAACNTDNKVADYGEGGGAWSGEAMCHMEAPGFEALDCCGMDASCKSEEASKFGRMSCSKFPEGTQEEGTQCVWSVKSMCDDIEADQKAAVDAKKNKEKALANAAAETGDTEVVAKAKPTLAVQ